MIEATDSELRKWSRLLLLRDSALVIPGRADSPRMGICVLCGVNVFHRTSNLQAHHIHPKSLFPEMALTLSNGVMVCAGHHQGIVHAFNPGVDVAENRIDAGWRIYVPTFDRWVHLAPNEAFNRENQGKLRDLTLPSSAQ